MDVLTLPKRKNKTLNEIRVTLNACFPKTQFSVKACDEGNYYFIKISYTDGASLTRVKNAVSCFRRPANPDINFQGISIEVSRNMSAETKRLLLGELKSVFNLKTMPGEKDWVQAVNSTAGDYANKIFRMRDFE